VTSCAHLDATPLTPAPSSFQAACSDCLAVDGRWVHLRRCLTCGHVACCDSSPARHASAHARTVGHPVVTSAEPGENWRWCYLDEVGA
jgi:Zn-finger in ubiquitin-hydrolases and other protein